MIQPYLRMTFKIAIVLFLIAMAVAQSPGPAQQHDLPVISPEVAKENLISSPQPEYPPLAKAARIVGIVRLSIVIDEQGAVKPVSLISGHPMLAPAALDGVRKWKYKPFQVDGKAVAVQTIVQISIPENISQPDIDRERKFQDSYWPNERAASDALKKNDLVTAEAKLALARAASEERGDEKWMELADVIAMQAAVKERQQDYAASEALLKDSLAIHRKHQNADEAEVASAEFQLAGLYVQMQRPTEAEPLLAEAIKTWELRVTDTPMAEAKSDYEWHLALSYFAMARIAVDSNHLEDARVRCEKAIKLAERAPGKPYMNDVKSGCASIQGQ